MFDRMSRLADRREPVSARSAFQLVRQQLELRLIVPVDRGTNGCDSVVQLGEEFFDQFGHSWLAEKCVKLRTVPGGGSMPARRRRFGRDFAQVILQNLKQLLPFDRLDRK